MKPRKSNILTQFGVKLRSRRHELNLTQEGLALMIGVDRTYISGLERGTRNPTLIVLERLASGLETTISDLLRKLT